MYSLARRWLQPRRSVAAIAAIMACGLVAACTQAPKLAKAPAETDSTKAAVPGATVTATNRATGAQRVVVSSGDGTYRLPDLDPGRYSVTIELDTFQKVVVDDVIVLLGRTVGVDAELKPGVLTETVNVTGRLAARQSPVRVVQRLTIA